MKIENKTFDAERALYNLQDSEVIGCTFAGKADGESALKEARKVNILKSDFDLRYPLWHVADFSLTECSMSENARAAIWYAKNGKINNSYLGGIKAVRECDNIELNNCKIKSPEFGWYSNDIRLTDSEIESEYLFLNSKNIKLERVKQQGKYSFQYIENLQITNSELNTKDAFWHTKNTVIKDTILKGEYLGWYSDGLTLINCHIDGTQPLCYCKNLKLINCTMKNCDLSFEYSDVTAEIKGHIDSVKNPRSGKITADTIGEVILADSIVENKAEIVCNNENGLITSSIPT